MRIRRVFAVLLCLACLFSLASCGSKPPAPPARFTAQAAVRFGEKEIAAQVSQEAPGALEVTFSAPEELRGMALSIRGDTAALRFGELRAELPAQSLPAAGFAPLLSQALLRLARQDGCKRTRGGWLLTGTAGGVSYRAAIARDGRLERLEVPAMELEVVLT